MVRFIFYLLITCVVIAIAGFFVKNKLGLDFAESFNVDAFSGSVIKDKFFQKDNENDDDSKTLLTYKKNEEDKISTNEDENNEADVYFLKVSNTDKVKVATSKKEVTNPSDKFRVTMEALFSGPSRLQKISGVYSEIPANTKLLGIKEDANSYTINISDDFEMGGGADSMKIRVKQLVTTATQAAGGKDVYLEINGKRVEYVGGEGIMVLQPLQRNL